MYQDAVNYFEANPTILLGVIAVGLILRFIISFSIADAASRKNRSFKSFFWLTLLFDWTVMALIVAIIPFHEKDPRRPTNSWEIQLEDEDGE